MEDRNLSADEMKQYDRQLRLWGLTSQTRMLRSKILIVGLGGMAVEICKNLVLAGVGALTIMDHKNVELSDLGSQFFLTEASVGNNRAESSLDGLRALNANVAITADHGDVSGKDQAFFEGFDVVCLTNHAPDVQMKVNALCRGTSKNIYFFSVEVFGWYGYFHQDLGEHAYTVKKAGETEGETKSEECKATFQPLSTIYKATWTSIAEIYGKRLLPTARLYCAFQVVHAFREKHGRLPTSEDSLQCLQIRDAMSSSNGLATDWLPENVLGAVISVCDCVLNPVCAIFGGLIGSEILKVVSGQDKPWENTVVFDAQSSQAVPKDIK